MIIYQPDFQFIDLRNSLITGLVDAATLGALDFVAESNKSWAYYTGAALGGAAAATGIVGASFTVYAVAETLDILVFKSEEGSNIDVFIDGVATGQITTYLANAAWENFVVDLGNRKQARVDFVNAGVAAGNTSGISWMALGPLTTNNTDKLISGVQTMATRINFLLRDSETNERFSSFPVYVQDGLETATLQALADRWIPLIEGVSGCEVAEVEVTLSLATTAKTVLAPVAGIVGERGGLVTFSTSGPRAESVRIPGIRTTIMPGDEFSITDAAVQAVTDELVATPTVNTEVITYYTPYGYTWDVPQKGKKSSRKF